MKRVPLGLSLLLLVLVACTALYPESPKPLVHIRIKYDSTFVPGSMDHIFFQYEGEIIDGPEPYYDTGGDSIATKWDSTRMGHYTIEMHSLLLGSYQIEYDVYSDTTLFVPNRFSLALVDTLTLQELYDADTVVCVYVSTGCFHHSVYKVTLLNKEDLITLNQAEGDAIPAHRKVNTQDACHTLDQMHRALVEAEQYTPECMSTSTTRFYLQADHKLYYMYDPCGRWSGGGIPF